MSAPFPAEWQPIETAPKDGTDVFLSDCNVIWAGRWRHVVQTCNGIVEYDYAEWSMPSEFGRRRVPLWWVPLPFLPDLPEASDD